MERKLYINKTQKRYPFSTLQVYTLAMCKYKCIILISSFLERDWGVKNRKTQNRLVHMD